MRQRGDPVTEADVEYVRECLRRERDAHKRTKRRLRDAESRASLLGARVDELLASTCATPVEPRAARRWLRWLPWA